MANNSGVNLDISNLSVGFSIGGGTTKRTLTVNGSGNTTLTSQQNIVLTLPNRATDTVVGYGDYSAKGVVLVGTASGTFTALAVGSDTFVLTADSGQTSGVKWAAASSSVSPGGVGSWVDVTGTSQSMAVNTGYISDNAGLVTCTLPTTAAQGTVLRMAGNGAGGWKIAQNASQNIKIGNQTTTTGTGGSLASTNQYDQIELLCTVANTTWVAMSGWGNITVV
jgi:hypothetical protein